MGALYSRGINKSLEGKSFDEQMALLDSYQKDPTAGLAAVGSTGGNKASKKDPRPLGDTGRGKRAAPAGQAEALFRSSVEGAKTRITNEAREKDSKLGKVTPKQQLADASEQGITAGQDVDYSLGANGDEVEGGDIDTESSEGGGRKRKREGGSGSIRV